MKIKYIGLTLLVGAAISMGYITENRDSLGERIGMNIAKMRHHQIEQAVAGGSVDFAQVNMGGGLSVHQHIDQLQAMTPSHCQQAKRFLSNAKSHYSHRLYDAKVNQQLTKQRDDAC